MRRLQHVFIYSMILNILSVFAFAVDPSTRPGKGAIPYSGGTTFRVWAPNAATVTVAGNFNSWSITANPLVAEGAGDVEGVGYWSADVTSADLYDQYKYVIDGSLWRIDPRANYVTSSVGNGVIDDNSYSWTPFTPPAWNDMVIYEMHIGSFYDPVSGSPPGTWFNAASNSKLDHIQSLGVNVVEVMPIAEFAGDYSLGYNPANIFAPEGAYGSPSQMRNFIDQCHQRGIAVLIDVVYNHFGPSDLGDSLWQFDGYSYNGWADRGGIYFYEDDNRFTPWGDTRPNFLTGEVRSFIRDNVMYWLGEYNMDGIRMDGTAYMRERDIGGPDIPEGWSLMQWINDEIDAAYPEKISIAEDMRTNSWITKATDDQGGAGFDSQWDPGFHHKLLGDSSYPGVLTEGDDVNRDMYDVRDIILNNYNGVDTQRVIYTESHDEVGLSSGKSRVPSRISPTTPTDYWAKKRSTLGAGIVFTSPGIPMIFMGQEFLETGQWHDNTPLDWSNDTTFAGIKLMYQHLISLRRNLSDNTLGLMAGNVNVHHVNDTDKVIAYHRWWNGGLGDDVIVVANFSYQGIGEITDYNIGMPQGGRWRVRLNSDWIGYDSEFLNWDSSGTNAVAGGKDGMGYNANVTVAPYSFVILSQGTDPDLDESGSVDLKDFAIFSQQWQQSCDDSNCADFDMSGLVDMTDLYTFVSRWLDEIP